MNLFRTTHNISNPLDGKHDNRRRMLDYRQCAIAAVRDELSEARERGEGDEKGTERGGESGEERAEIRR